MDYLGMLCLGGFVGVVVTSGLALVSDFGLFQRAVTIVLSAALSGASVAFIERFRSQKAIGAYCVGLLLGLMWSYTPVAVQHITSQQQDLVLLGWAQLVAVGILSAVAAALFLPPAVRDLKGPNA